MLPVRQIEELLKSAGIRVSRVRESQGATRPSRFDISSHGNKARFVVLQRQRAPYPGEVEALASTHQELSTHGVPLLSAPFITESLGARLNKAGWSWADDLGNWDIRAPGVLLQRRVANKPTTTRQRKMPRGPGSLKIIRWLANHATEASIGATELAETVGITRPRATQVLQALADLELCEKVGRGEWTAKREALLDAFIEQYRGPGGTEQHFYSLRPPGEAATTLAEKIESTKSSWVISADVAGDLIAPHRRPSHLIVYGSGYSLRTPDDWVEAHGREDANIIVRSAADESVSGFGLTRQLGEATLPLADPTQIMWDLIELGGEDRLEVAEKVRTWILKSHKTS